MSRLFSRSIPVLAVALAIVVAGCGGSSGGSGGAATTGTTTISASAYKQQLDSADKQIRSAFSTAQAQGLRNPSAWYTLAGSLKRVHDKLASLKPPAKIAPINAAIVRGLAPLPAEVTSIGNDIKHKDITAAKKDVLTFEHSALALQSSIQSAVSKTRSG